MFLQLLKAINGQLEEKEGKGEKDQADLLHWSLVCVKGIVSLIKESYSSLTEFALNVKLLPYLCSRIMSSLTSNNHVSCLVIACI